MKKFCILLLILLITTAGIGFWGLNQLQQALEQPISVSQEQLFTLEKGTNGKKLTALLTAQQILPKSTLLEKTLPWVIQFDPQYSQIKAGTYDISTAKNTADLLKLFNAGKEAQFALRFTDGETVKQVLKSLENAPHLENSLQGKSSKEIITLLGLPETASLEGWIYPDTYHYTPNSTDLTLLKRATDRMQKALDMAWQQREKDLPLKTPYEMLILASIVEKETAIDNERSKVASVFVNRLNAGMKLQTDPTVIYGMGDEYKGNIRKKDLETATAYNTYVIDGLPPTPIAMPSEKSLLAVAKPEKTGFIYFVADGSGGHKFSKTLDEHNRAVQEYLRWYRSQKNNGK